MKSIPVFIIAAALAVPGLAQTPKNYPRVTGQQLVELLAVSPESKKTGQLSDREHYNHKLADNYIDGVLDATVGVNWCSNGRWKPNTVYEKVIWGLRGLPAESLKRGAAPLIVEILRPLLPCSGKQ